jgi:enoyl-CoA hydratase/carnithine racemase
MAAMTEGGSVRLEMLEGGVAAIVLDAGAAPFTFGEAQVRQLSTTVRSISARSDVAGVLIRSVHPTVFCAGADVEAIAAVSGRAETERLVALGQNALEELARLPQPTVALVGGLCVGGGLELALACSARVATDRAKLGLPEVKLGIIPAWGGSTRLPRLIGLVAAIDLITAGRVLNAPRAARLGLVDLIAPAELLEAAARELIAAARSPAPSARSRRSARAATSSGRAPAGASFPRPRATTPRRSRLSTSSSVSTGFRGRAGSTSSGPPWRTSSGPRSRGSSSASSGSRAKARGRRSMRKARRRCRSWRWRSSAPA